MARPTAIAGHMPAFALAVAVLLHVSRQQHYVTAQQISPLLGQGMDPVAANEVNSSVPVYLSIALNRVLDVDEKGYRFTVDMLALVSWQDPRADAIFKRVTANRALYNWQARNANDKCGEAVDNSMSVNGTLSLEAGDICKTALTMSKPDDCQKLCNFQYLGWGCCDSLWIPNINLLNAEAYSQDNWVYDRVTPQFSPIASTLNNNTVVRKVRLQGTFSNQFDFKRYPFDSQILSIPFVTGEPAANYHLVPSYVGRNTPDQGTDSGHLSSSAKLEEVTGWTITAAVLYCDTALSSDAAINSTTKIWQNMSTDDPLYVGEMRYLEFIQNSTQQPIPDAPVQLPTLCTLEIHIKRDFDASMWLTVFPTLLIGLMAFAVFVTHPTDLDIRLGTTTGLFLSLVAVQFTVVDQVPKTNYNSAFTNVILTSYCLLSAILLEAVVVYCVSSFKEFEANKGRDIEALQAQSQREGKGVAEGANAESPNRKRSFLGMVSLRRMLAQEHTAGYRVACYIDWVCLPSFFVVYVVVVVCFFCDIL